MKKKIFFASATVLFAVATVFNMTLLQENNTGDISLESIEVMVHAHGEQATYGGLSNFLQGQGFYKDEREWHRLCPSSSSSSTSANASGGGYSAGGSHSSSQSNPPERYEIKCPYGNENCTEINC